MVDKTQGKLNELRDFVGEINKSNGFHERDINIGELCALITSETSEMLEAHRVNKHSDIDTFGKRFNEVINSINEPIISKEDWQNRYNEVFKQQFKNHIKEGLEAELVDCLIRCFDTAYRLNIDLDTLFNLIIFHNSIRGFKHGKSY